MSDMWLYHAFWVGGQVVRPYWRLRILGPVDRIPRRGPLLIAANHCSFLDPWFVGIVFPRPIRYVITQQWYHLSRFWNAFFRACGTVPVREDEPGATIREIHRLLDRGEACGIFPEGRISFDGRIQRFRSGLSRIAATSGAPVVPVGIRGSYEAIPRTRRFPRPARVTVHVGEPLVFPGSPHDGPPPRAESRQFLRTVFEQVCRLADQEDRIGLFDTNAHSGRRAEEPRG